MPIARIDQDCNLGVYFLTPTIRNWYYIFDRHDRWHILADSLVHCQKHKGLGIYAYVFMLNHLHLIVRSPDVAGFVRDFKRLTSKVLKENIARSEPKVLNLFTDGDGGYSFWKPDNQPKLLENESFALQKLNYIHENPVQKSYVEQAKHWKWSSANPSGPIRIETFGALVS